MKKYLSLFVALLVLASVAPTMAQDQVTIRWWHIQTNEAEANYWQQVADDYMAMHPDVNIEITVLENEAFKSRITTVMQAGDPPDLFQSWGGGVLWTYADAGMVRDISPELNANDGEWRNSFATQAALELFGQDGEYYGVPWTWGAVGIFYNRDLFEQAGLDPDAPPATWEEFLDAVQTLKDAGITPIALSESEKWTGHFWWVYLALRLGGGEAFLAAYNREGSFADEPFVQAGEYLQQLIDLDPFPEGYLGLAYADQATAMVNGEAAMELMGHWAPAFYRFLSTDNEEAYTPDEGLDPVLGWFPFPVIEGGAGNPDDVLGGGDGFAVGINAPDETVDFLRYITSEEVQRGGAEIWIVPTVVGAQDVFEDDPVMAAIMEARNNAPYFQLYYDQFLPPAVGEAVNDNVERLFAGVATPEEVANAIEEVAAFELMQ